jgi:glucans biosynthesis protein
MVVSTVTTRRQFLLTGVSAGLAAAAASAAQAPAPESAAGLSLGAAQAFSFDELRAHAQALSKASYVEPAAPAADIVRTLSFDAIQNISFRPELTLWRRGPGKFPIRFFHLNRYVGLPVRIHIFDGKVSQEILYHARYFDYGDAALASRLPENLGFAGFRVMSGRGSDTDWLAFQGASYFRAAGAQDQYGASARGIAVNTALSTREEFPRFTEFWLQPGADGSPTLTIFALLDGRSVTGAFAFQAREDNGVFMEVDAQLYAREDIERLGIAPLTSMFWYRANDLRRPLDWRPAIHDSDGLALWTGQGERVWRPLNDPAALQTNSFIDTHPKGFGLSQRDRDFDHYQDDGAFYERRPSIWVEPLDDWGSGAVQLVEIPTDDEIHDNIVAYWQPSTPVKQGSALRYRYRLYWQADDPLPAGGVARCVATRLGWGGVPGRARPKDQWKFVIDFEGGELASMKPRYDILPVVSLSRGKVLNPYSIKVVGSTRWRAIFDVALPGKDVLDLRCFLKLADQPLTETWVYQFFPPE